MSNPAQKVTNLGSVFDATQIAPQQPMEAVPQGWYSVVLTDGEIKPTEGGEGRRMNLEWTITDGQYKGRKIFDGFNYKHSNPQTQQIAAGQVSAICHAVEVFNLTDITQLLNRPHQIKVGIEPAKCVDADGFDCPVGTPNSKQYEPRNTFKGAKAGSAPAPAAGAGGPAPAWVPGAPAAAPAPAPTGAPWTPAAPAAAVVPPPAPAASVVKGKPGRKAKPAAAPAAAPAPVAAPAPERMFYIGLEGDAYANAFPESKIVEYLRGGMPANTPLVLEGESDYKDAATYNIGAPVPAPAPAPVAPPVAAPAPAAAPWAAATPAPAAPAPAATVPPWGK